MLDPFVNQLVLMVAGVAIGWSLQLAGRFLIVSRDVARNTTPTAGSPREAAELLALLAVVVLVTALAVTRVNLWVLGLSVIAGAVGSAAAMGRREPKGGAPVTPSAGLISAVVTPGATLAVFAALALVSSAVGGPEVANPVPTFTPSPTTPAPTTPTPTSSASPTASTHNLTVTKAGTGSGTVASRTEELVCASRCAQTTHTYGTGQRVDLGATPTFGSRFVGWSGACTGTAACTLDLATERTVSAQFNLLPSPLGFQAQFAGQSTRVTLAPGQSGSLSVSFTNTGSQAWVRGTGAQIDLAECCPVNVPSPYASWIKGVDASTYATATVTTVSPGQIATFSFSVTVPAGTPPGSYTLEGRLVRRSDGAVIDGGTYTQVVDVR